MIFPPCCDASTPPHVLFQEVNTLIPCPTEEKQGTVCFVGDERPPAVTTVGGEGDEPKRVGENDIVCAEADEEAEMAGLLSGENFDSKLVL